MPVLYLLCAWTWMREDEYLLLREGAKDLSSKENSVLVSSEVEGPLNKEAKNVEKFWLGHFLITPLPTD